MAKVYIDEARSRKEDGPPIVRQLLTYGHRTLKNTRDTVRYPCVILSNLIQADVIILLTSKPHCDPPDSYYELGVATGAALALNKIFYIIGPRTESFHRHEGVIHYADMWDFFNSSNGEWRPKGGWRAADDPPRLPGTYSLWVAPGVPHEAAFDGGKWAVDPHTFIYGWFDPMFVGFARIPPLITFGDK